MDFAGQADFGEQPNSPIVRIDLVPSKAVAGGDGVGVVVVVPAFAAGEQRNPPIVARVVASIKAAAAPKMGGGVDQPGGVQAERDAQKASPKQHSYGAFPSAGEPSEAEEERAADGDRHPVVFAEPDIEAVAFEVGNIAGEELGLRVQSIAPDDPSDVSPPAAFAGSVRIALAVAVLMMDAMGGHPEDGSALKRERGADGHQVFQPLGRLVTAMGQQAVVAHADTDIDSQNGEHQHHRKPLPREEEECGQGADVKEDDDAEREPVDARGDAGDAAHANLRTRGRRGCENLRGLAGG